MGRTTIYRLTATGAIVLTYVWATGCSSNPEPSPVQDEKRVLQESISSGPYPGVEPGQVDFEALYQGGPDANAEVFEKAQRKLYEGYPGMNQAPQQNR